MNIFPGVSVSFFTDPLSAFFVFLILLIGLPSLVYSIGYLKGHHSACRIFVAAVLGVVFLLSMVGVVTLSNLIAFLVFWEIMSLVSYFLVLFDFEHDSAVKAGTIYAIMTHVGTAFICAAFFMLARYAQSFDFVAIKNALPLVPGNEKNVIFIFLFVGFATKAGLVPVHVWLPYAHPQAPSHISSIMSAVMIKTALYGMLRFILMLLGCAHLWWGILVLAMGIVSCVTGIIYALMEHNIKRLLAYSSVENVGVITAGLGIAMVCSHAGIQAVALFALGAALYHLLNHAVFKSLLFLCAGSIQRACAGLDMEEFGGLIRKLPYTCVCFLIGALAISSLPPLNGFVSEWLLLQSFFAAAMQLGGIVKMVVGGSAALLIFAGGLTAACFVKAFGVTFLALPRGVAAENAREVSGVTMKAAMAFLVLCIAVFSFGAPVIVRMLTPVAGIVLGTPANMAVAAAQGVVVGTIARTPAYVSTPLLGGLLAVLFVAVWWVYRAAVRRRGRRIYRTWDCGYYPLSSRNEYTATAFSKPFRIAFSFFLLPYRKTQKVRESFYHVKSFLYETHTTKIFKDYAYGPAVRAVFSVARHMRRLQPGSIHIYIAYIFVTILVLLFFFNKF